MRMKSSSLPRRRDWAFLTAAQDPNLEREAALVRDLFDECDRLLCYRITDGLSRGAGPGLSQLGEAPRQRENNVSRAANPLACDRAARENDTG